MVVSSKTAIAAELFLGVLFLGIAFDIIHFGPPSLGSNIPAEVFPVAALLCFAPFLVARLTTRSLSAMPFARSLVVRSLTGACGMATLLIMAEVISTWQSVDPSAWLLCLYLGIVGLGVGFFVHYCGLAASKAFPRSKARNNGA